MPNHFKQRVAQAARQPELHDTTLTRAGIALPALVPIGKSKEHYGWSRATSYRLAAAGAIRLLKVGNGTFVQTESALAYIAKLPVMVPKMESGR